MENYLILSSILFFAVLLGFWFDYRRFSSWLFFINLGTFWYLYHCNQLENVTNSEVMIQLALANIVYSYFCGSILVLVTLFNLYSFSKEVFFYWSIYKSSYIKIFVWISDTFLIFVLLAAIFYLTIQINVDIVLLLLGCFIELNPLPVDSTMGWPVQDLIISAMKKKDPTILSGGESPKVLNMGGSVASVFDHPLDPKKPGIACVEMTKAFKYCCEKYQFMGVRGSNAAIGVWKMRGGAPIICTQSLSNVVVVAEESSSK